jgi:hypothetical protein
MWSGMTEFVKRGDRTGKRLTGRSVILMFTSNVSNRQTQLYITDPTASTVVPTLVRSTYYILLV